MESFKKNQIITQKIPQEIYKSNIYMDSDSRIYNSEITAILLSQMKKKKNSLNFLRIPRFMKKSIKVLLRKYMGMKISRKQFLVYYLVEPKDNCLINQNSEGI